MLDNYIKCLVIVAVVVVARQAFSEESNIIYNEKLGGNFSIYVTKSTNYENRSSPVGRSDIPDGFTFVPGKYLINAYKLGIRSDGVDSTIWKKISVTHNKFGSESQIDFKAFYVAKIKGEVYLFYTFEEKGFITQISIKKGSQWVKLSERSIDYVGKIKHGEILLEKGRIKVIVNNYKGLSKYFSYSALEEVN